MRASSHGIAASRRGRPLSFSGMRSSIFNLRSWPACTSCTGCCAARIRGSSRSIASARWSRAPCSVRPTRHTWSCTRRRGFRSNTRGSSCLRWLGVTKSESRAAACAVECGCATCWPGTKLPAAPVLRPTRHPRRAPCPARIGEMQQRNIFAGPYLDRTAHLRQDPAWFAAALADERSRAIPVWNSRNLIAEGDAPRAAYLELSLIPSERRNSAELILLGRFGDTNYFTYEVESIDPPSLLPGTRFEDLRVVASVLPIDEAGLLGYARAIISWRRRHRFCGTCGAKNLSAKSGHVLVCSNPSCRHEQFPRIDPAIIVLVSDGERALLGRQASWPVGRYSTIAGFVEPGESLEDAVAREVLEETGIVVDQIEYHSSQPWPFPASLMLGFTAHALTTEVHLRDEELEDARWFQRADLAANGALLPPRQSISFRLVEDWFDAGSDVRLRDIQGSTSWPQSR